LWSADHSLRNADIRDLVSCAKPAVYYHILVGGVVVKLLVVHMGVNIVSRAGELLIR
jgi:hypothetical protein